jgi:hypothetical protein
MAFCATRCCEADSLTGRHGSNTSSHCSEPSFSHRKSDITRADPEQTVHDPDRQGTAAAASQRQKRSDADSTTKEASWKPQKRTPHLK